MFMYINVCTKQSVKTVIYHVGIIKEFFFKYDLQNQPTSSYIIILIIQAWSATV